MLNSRVKFDFQQCTCCLLEFLLIEFSFIVATSESRTVPLGSLNLVCETSTGNLTLEFDSNHGFLYLCCLSGAIVMGHETESSQDGHCYERFSSGRQYLFGAEPESGPYCGRKPVVRAAMISLL